MTTVRRSWLRGYADSYGLSVTLLARVRVAMLERAMAAVA